jgi:secreted PhoX family phosphatase
MKTEADPAGEAVLGTLGNCSAGKTPWGTVLSAEENFQDLFSSGKGAEGELRKSYDRYGVPDAESSYGWEQSQPRFRASEHPNEPNRFGWVVEVDPYDPEWQPCKRTALGRFRHEAATTFITPSGQVVLYSGDDARFEYIYKFVCSRPFDANDRTANRGILDEGVLYVAQFNEDGSGVWLPIIQGQGPLTPENGFHDQGDVVVNVRIAADLLGATKMDRPEDMEVNPVNKKLYIACTNNTQRGTGSRPGKDKMNPRNENKHGHVIELTEAGDDHAATAFEWEHFIVCGDPEDPETYFAGFPKDRVAAISCPDNVAFDNLGHLWIATDGMPSTLKVNDCLYAVAVDGPERGLLKRFMSAVPGAEVCGPEFTPDNRTLFIAIQHPGEGSAFAAPKTSWPGSSGAPRPAVIAIEARDRSVIGARPGVE